VPPRRLPGIPEIVERHDVHDVPEDRASADLDQRLGDGLGGASKASSLTPHRMADSIASSFRAGLGFVRQISAEDTPTVQRWSTHNARKLFPVSACAPRGVHGWPSRVVRPAESRAAQPRSTKNGALPSAAGAAMPRHSALRTPHRQEPSLTSGIPTDPVPRRQAVVNGICRAHLSHREENST
jgi:hypothetical protein